MSRSLHFYAKNILSELNGEVLNDIMGAAQRKLIRQGAALCTFALLSWVVGMAMFGSHSSIGLFFIILCLCFTSAMLQSASSYCSLQRDQRS